MTYTRAAMSPEDGRPILRERGAPAGLAAAARRSRRGPFPAVLVALLLPATLLADRRDQVAADKYTDALAAIDKKRYAEAAKLLQEALARGATEPNEQQGSQTRYLVYQYDPYYWLGVAFMEMKDDDKALLNFEKSESYGVIRKWGPLYRDLVRRKEAIERRSGALVAAATPVPAPTRPAAPTPTAVAIAAATPPAPTPTIVIRIGDARPATPTPVAVAAGQPTPSPDLDGLRALEREITGWSGEPGLKAPSRALLAERQRRVAALVRTPPGRPLPQNALADERKAMQERVLPAIRRDLLESALDALLAEDWGGVDKALATASRAEPGAPQIDVLRAVALGTRYLLGQKRESALRDGARTAFSAWRAKVGSARALPGLVSPALETVLR